jgi:hypothetical protein
MKTRISGLLGLLSFLLLWLLPGVTRAAPPDTDHAKCLDDSLDSLVRIDSCNAWLDAVATVDIDEKLEKQLADVLRQIERKSKKATKAKLEQLRANIERPRDSGLHFVSAQEAERSQAVERFEVVINPIEDDHTAKHLAEACRELSKEMATLQDVALPGPVAPITSLQAGQAAELANAIEALRGAGKDVAAEKAKDVAAKLLLVGGDINRLCTKIVTGRLDDADIVGLREVFNEDAQTILRYEQLLVTKPQQSNKSVAKLAAELIAGKITPEDLTKFISTIVPLDLSGTPRSFPTGINLGGVAATAFEGLAEFLIDRGKEETLHYIRDTLVKRVCRSDVGVFVPKTCKVMQDLDPSMALSAIGKMLHAAVLDDLELLPDRVLVLAWGRSPEFAYSATLVRLALPMLEDAELRRNPLDYAAGIYAMPETDCEAAAVLGDRSGDGRCAETLAYLRFASALLRASASNIETATKPTYDPTHLPFLSLGVAFEFERLFAELPPSAHDWIAGKLNWEWDPVTLELRFSSAGIMGLTSFVDRSLPLATNLKATLMALSQTNVFGESTATPESVLTAARSTFVGLAELAQIAVELDTSRPKDDTLAQVLNDSSQLVAMSDAIRADDWGSSALALFEVVCEMMDMHADASVSVRVSVIFDEIGRYLPLFVEIANAKSSADVKAALEAAFPAGGYRLKYRQPTVALNGFLGLYGGGLLLSGPSPQLTGEVAMFAPIGVETTWPVKSATRKAWHLGFLLAIVDLGAITTAKFLETEIAEPPTDDMGNVVDGNVTTHEEPSKFNVASLLSPGAYFTVGVAESPFSFGVGASVNPFAMQLVDRSYVAGEVDSQSQSYLTAVRFGAFLAVDITIVAFGRKGRSKR